MQLKCIIPEAPIAPESFRNMFARILLLLALASPLPAVAAEGLVSAENLRADAERVRRERVPLLLFFAARGCPYCREVEELYLRPIQADPAYAGRVMIRVIHIESRRELTGFDGERTDHARFARDRGIYLTPTLQFLDARGREIAAPLIGLGLRDFYGGYLDDSIAAALKRLRG
jgi:thioredoxin-related protein